MFKIREVKVEISISKSMEKYGFSHKFQNGLNILCGHNSSGKSSILSSIYYALGMEQLLGMSGKQSGILDKCLTSTFKYKNELKKVKESTVHLTIENDNLELATIKRIIYSTYNESNRPIEILESNKQCPVNYFLHATGDHDNQQGFYYWLGNFIGIKLPTIEKDNGTTSKELYMQNVFSACFIEQTKGWSDFYAQMPSFAIKDSKRKLSEYFLSLECLENDLKKDRLNKDKKYILDRWNYDVEKFNDNNSKFIFCIPTLNETYANQGPNKIDKLKLLIKMNNNWVVIQEILTEEKKAYSSLIKNNKKPKLEKTEYGIKQKTIKLEILKLNRILNDITRNYSIEKMKFSEYERTIVKLKNELSRINSAQKTSDLFSKLLDTDMCPVCDSTLAINKINTPNTTSFDYEVSVVFFKSQIKLFETYLSQQEDFEKQFLKQSSFYTNEISRYKYQLLQLNKETSNPSGELSRELLLKEVMTHDRILDLEGLIEKFNNLQSQLKAYAEDLGEITIEIKALKTSFERDTIKTITFQKKLQSLLKLFNYSSNECYEVKVKEAEPFKLTPSVYNENVKSYQPVRLSSSASDFIRSEWAFYLSLLEISTTHPGLIIFDEPGQHAMNMASMQSLCQVSNQFSNKQIILAISKDSPLKEKDKEVKINIENMLNGLSGYNLIDVDKDGEKAVKTLKYPETGSSTI